MIRDETTRGVMICESAVQASEKSLSVNLGNFSSQQALVEMTSQNDYSILFLTNGRIIGKVLAMAEQYLYLTTTGRVSGKAREIEI